MSATFALLVALGVERWLSDGSWVLSTYALATLVVLSLLRSLWPKSTVVPMDDATLALLDSTPEVDVRGQWVPRRTRGASCLAAELARCTCNFAAGTVTIAVPLVDTIPGWCVARCWCAGGLRCYCEGTGQRASHGRHPRVR